MTTDPKDFVLFPHMAIREGDLRRLSIFLPRLTFMEAVDPPRIPAWAGERTAALRPRAEGDREERVRRCLAGYRDLGALHGDSGMLSAIVRDWGLDPAESRTGIQGFLRSGPGARPDLRDEALVEAAVFLEMARILDEEEIELDRNVLRARRLEEEFREIVGAAEDEETRKELETLNVSLDIDRGHLDYMLRERIGMWLRLLGSSAWRRPAALVAGSPEVTREMLEASIPKAGNAADCRPAARQIRIASLPDPANLTEENFQALLSRLMKSGVLESTWTTLGLYLGDPNAPVLEETLREKVTALQAEFTEAANEGGYSNGGESTELWLTCFSGLTWGELWRFFDRKGFDVLGADAAFPTQESVPPLLYVASAENEE